MISTDVWIGLGGQNQSVASFLADEKLKLSLTQLVEVENQLRILHDYVIEQFRKGDHFTERLSKIKQRDIEDTAKLSECLVDTVRHINAKGSLQAWLAVVPSRRCSAKQNLLLSSFMECVETDTHNLTPIIGVHELKVCSRINAILWLTVKHASLAHALLLLYSFTASELKVMSAKGIYYIFGYLVGHEELLHCEPLKMEAWRLRERLQPTMALPLLTPDDVPVKQGSQSDKPYESTAAATGIDRQYIRGESSHITGTADKCKDSEFRQTSAKPDGRIVGLLTQRDETSEPSSTPPTDTLISPIQSQNDLGYLPTEPASCSVAPPVCASIRAPPISLKRKRYQSPDEHNDEREDRVHIAAVDMEATAEIEIDILPNTSELLFATKRTKRSVSPAIQRFSGHRFSMAAVASDAASHSSHLALMMHQLSSRSLQLLRLFTVFAGVQVPKLLFDRLSSPQLRWNSDGYPVHIPFVSDSGIPLLDMFDPACLAESLKELLSGPWIYEQCCSETLASSYSILEEARRCAANLFETEDLQCWHMLALELACHVFPRDPALQEGFLSHGRALIPIIDHFSGVSKVHGLPESTKVALAEVFVARSRLGDPSSCQRALNEAVSLLGEQTPDHLKASIALQRSILARLQGDFHLSEKVISDYQRKVPSATNARLRSINRLLLTSHLENLIQLEEYKDALKQVGNFEKWESDSENWSPMELSVNFKKWSTISKIYQACGELQMARSCLDSCYPFLKNQRLAIDPNRFQIICRLADLLCVEGSCVDARSKIDLEIQSIRNRKFAKAFRRLKVSSVDVDLAEGKYDDASSSTEWLKQQFEEISSPDISDQWLHVRTLVASALISHCKRSFHDAISGWEQVLSLLKRYQTLFAHEGFFYGLCQLSISFARMKTAHLAKESSSSDLASWHAETRQTFDKGCAILRREEKNYWIPRLCTDFMPELLKEIHSAEPTWAAENDAFSDLRQRYPGRVQSRI